MKTFEEIKEFLEKEEENINLLIPEFALSDVVREMLRRIDVAIHSSDEEKPEPLIDTVINDVNLSLDWLVENTLDMSFTEDKRELLDALVLLYSNFNDLYLGCFQRPFLIRVLALFLESERTIENSIYLNTYLISKIKSSLSQEPSTTALSKKYFYEYQYFLNKKENEDYSIPVKNN